MSLARAGVVGALLASSVAVFEGASVAAQGDLELRIAPRVGILDPGGPLYSSVAVLPPDRLVFSESRLGSAGTLGASVLLGSGAWAVYVRASVDHAPSVDTRVTAYLPPPPSGGIPEGATFDAGASASLTELGAELVLPLRLEIGPLRPFVSGGAGLARYRFSAPEFNSPPPVDVTLPVSGTRGSWRVGGGVDVTVWGWRASLAAVDAFGSYFGETQHYVYVVAEVWFDVVR